MAKSSSAPPVLLLSHGTTMLTGEQSDVRDYWKFHGDKALEYPVKGIIMMVSHLRPRVVHNLSRSKRMSGRALGGFGAQGARCSESQSKAGTCWLGQKIHMD